MKDCLLSDTVYTLDNVSALSIILNPFPTIPVWITCGKDIHEAYVPDVRYSIDAHLQLVSVLNMQKALYKVLKILMDLWKKNSNLMMHIHVCVPLEDVQMKAVRDFQNHKP